MISDKERFAKVLAVAVNPGAYEGEAIAALLKARQLAKKNPSLANGETASPLSLAHQPPPEQSVQFRITKIPFAWLKICMNSLSAEAYGLGLKSKLYCDFTEIPTALDVRCDGSQEACDAFKAHLDWLIEYVSDQPRKFDS
jgi:hypothetical protein